MANIPVTLAIKNLLDADDNTQFATALSALGAGSPTLFSNTTPVNGSLGYFNTSVLKPDGTNIVATPFFLYNVENGAWFSEGYVPFSTPDAGWAIYKADSTNWYIEYYVDFAVVGYWTGVGAGADPASSTIVWTPIAPSLGTPLFTYDQTSGSTVGKVGQVLHSTIANNVFRYECTSEFPYTWQLDSTVTVSNTTPTNPILGMVWFDESASQSIFYTGSSWVGSKYGLNIQRDGYTRALAAHMTAQVDSRLAGKDAATDMRLFTGLTSNQAATVFPQNATCWLNDLRSQLCGFHMGAGNYGQSYGLLPLGGRFFLGVRHNGPDLGTTYWPLPDGTTFTTTTQRIFKDTGARAAYDFSIYITAAAAPATLSVIPILNLDINLDLMYTLNPPTVYISQGGSSATGIKQATPQNRKCAVMPFGRGYYTADTYALRSSFGHGVSTGDSNCPQYLLINDKLYLHQMNTNTYASISTGNGLNYIQDLVNRAAAAHGISPVAITTVTNPPLPLV